MTNNSFAGSCLKFTLLAKFFEGLDSWAAAEKLSPVHLNAYTAFLNTEKEKMRYDAFFRGTDADIYIPLWASVSCGGDGCLNNETTLEVLKLYAKTGYEPIDMDQNPPDYIGQLFRFAAYLCACSLHQNEQTEKDYFKDCVEQLTDKFLLPTTLAVVRGLDKYLPESLFAAFEEDLKNAFAPFIEISTEQLYAAAPEWQQALAEGPNKSRELQQAENVYTCGGNNCGGRCSICATVQENCLLRVEPSVKQGDPQLRMCVRGRSYRKTYMDPRRLRYPMIRVGERGEGKFRRISWEEAVDYIADEWVRIRDTYGVGSRYVNYATGEQGALRADHLMKRMLNVDGGRLDYYGTYSNHCTQYVTPYIYGDIFSGNSVEDVLNTKLLILWGHNPTETITGSQRAYYTALAKEKGLRVIVIDPRQSDSAISIADEWIGIRPSTDGALADAMAYTIWSEGLQNQEFMDRYCLGFDEDHMPEGTAPEKCYRNYLFGGQDGIVKDAEWASEITGIPAETIRRLAIEYATTKPACLLPGLGSQRIGNGEQTVRGIAVLPCLTGNIGIPGGGAAGTTMAIEEPGVMLPQGKNNYPGVISCFLWTKAIEHGTEMTRKADHIKGMERLDTNIKMIFNLAGNCLINQHSDINETTRILKDTGKCEFIVCSDVFMTASAKFADILLPGASFLEYDDIIGSSRRGHFLLSCNKTVQPLFASRTEYEWLTEVAAKIGIYDAFTEGNATRMDWLRTLYAELQTKMPEVPDFETFRREGGLTYRNPKTYIAYEKQIKDPENYRFGTPSGKIEIYSQQLEAFEEPERIPALPKYVPCPEGPADALRAEYPLQLIGWHTKRRCHSIHDRNGWLEEAEPHCMWINPADAETRGIRDGERVTVFNARGELEITAKVTERIIAGVVGISQGAWYSPDADGIDRRGCINVLTSLEPTPLSKGNPQHTNLVDVMAAKA